MRKFRSLAALMLVVIVAALSLSACGGGNTRDMSNLKIYLVTTGTDDSRWALIDAGCREEIAKHSGVSYEWVSPSEANADVQIECIDKAVKDGADAIILAPGNSDAMPAALKKASSKGVKIIYIDSISNFSATASVMTDNEAAGKLAGEKLIEALRKKGVMSGNIGILTSNVMPVSDSQLESGFRSAFVGTEYIIPESLYAHSDIAAYEQMAEILVNDDKFVAMFGTNETATIAAGNAIAASNGAIIGSGYDSSDEIKALIASGGLAFTVAPNSAEIGARAFRTAVSALGGEIIPNPGITVDVSVFTKDNLG